MERAQFVPFPGVAGEIGLRRSFAGIANRGEFAAVGFAQGGKGGFFGFSEGKQALHRFDHRGARFALAQEHPAAFTATFGEARIAEDADMPRHARLALAEHLCQLAHGQFHRPEQAGNAQPGRIAQRLEDVLDHHCADII